MVERFVTREKIIDILEAVIRRLNQQTENQIGQEANSLNQQFNSRFDILNSRIIALEETLSSVLSVNHINPNEIFVDNMDPQRPRIGLGDDLRLKIDKIYG